MPKLVLVYRGWIGAKLSDLETLRQMGVEVSDYNHEVGTFDRCSMTEAVHHVFVQKWKGYRVWGLTRKMEEVYTKKELDDVPF